MTKLVTIVNQGDTEARIARPSLLPAVVGSALLHLAAGSAFVLGPFGDSDQAPATTRPALAVTLVTPSSQQEVYEGTSALPELESSPPIQAEALQLTQEPLSESEKEPEDTSTTASTEPSSQEPQTEDSPAVEAAGPAGQGAPAVVLDTDQLQSAIGAYMASYKSGLVEEWVETCGHHRSRSASADPCPDGAAEPGTAPAARLFDLSVAPIANQKFDRQQLVAQSQYLETLVAEDSILGAVARQRYALVKEQYCFHYGCSPRGHNEPQGEVVELISVGGGP